VKYAVRLGWLVMAAAALSVSHEGMARAAEPARPPAPPSPPAGWEMPPPLAVKAAGKPKNGKKAESAACCKFDSTCCSRQSTIDEFVAPRASRMLDVRFADLPEAVVKEAPKDGPPFDGAPAARVTDDGGAPFPWPAGPKGYNVHITPPGRYGQVKFCAVGLCADGVAWPDPYFDPMEYRGMGVGTIRTIKPGPDKGKSLLVGDIEYVSFAAGEGGKVVVDEVKGKLAGSPDVKATFWMHAEAVDVAAGVVHAYRGPYRDEKISDQRVTFVLPEVILGFDSLDAKHTGGFFRSRFSQAWPFTSYHLPFGPGRSNLVNFAIDDWQYRRWFPRAKDAEKLPKMFRGVIAVSQTSVEAAPRVRILFVPVNSF
jgi:hypothetical protein